MRTVFKEKRHIQLIISNFDVAQFRKSGGMDFQQCHFRILLFLLTIQTSLQSKLHLLFFQYTYNIISQTCCKEEGMMDTMDLKTHSIRYITFSSNDGSLLALSQRKGRGPSTSFPIKLHTMLDNAEAGGYQDVISWLPGGKEFKIHDANGMVSVLSAHFNQTKYKSFLRQLQNYGFHRNVRGPTKGICSHRLFVRWDPLSCLHMKRGTYKAMNRSNELTPAMSSMVQQGHCLQKATIVDDGSQTTDQSSSDDDERDIVPLHPSKTVGGDGHFYSLAKAGVVVNTSSSLSSSTAITQEDWLSRLLDRDDLWSNNLNSNVNGSNLFEPNPVIFM